MPEADEKSWFEDVAKINKEKGPLSASWNILQDVTSLGGTYFARKLRELVEREAREHEKVLAQVKLDESLVRAHIIAIGIQLEAAAEILDRAHALLNPVHGRRKARLYAEPHHDSLARRATNVGLERFTTEYRSFLQTATGAGAGSAAAAGLWGAVQILGHASTGAAMASLHGAAATSAGWAWFGGGSLAAGGGGMALGHIVLPGVGTAIAVGVAAVLSYREVNQLQEALKELERANCNNLVVMRGTSEARKKYAEGEQMLIEEVAPLSAAVRVAHRQLRRFRLLSDLIRRIRFHLLGHYYTAADMEHVTELERAVDRFMAAFSRRP